MAARRPKVTVRRASTDDAEAFCAMFAQPRAMAGTLQLPYPSAEHWRKRIADLPPDDILLVAEVGGEVVGNAGLHANGRGRRRHVANIGRMRRVKSSGFVTSEYAIASKALRSCHLRTGSMKTATECARRSPDT